MPTAPTPHYTPEQLAQMAPAERQQRLTEMEQAGVDTTGLMGMINQVVATAKAGKQADEIGNNRVQELSSGEVQYVEGLQPSGANYPGVEHQEMSRYVTENLDAGQITEVSTAYHELHSMFSEFATQLKDAVGKSQHEWEGSAADQAHGYFDSLSTWADGNSSNAQLASEVMYQQSEAATTAKNSMPEEVPFDWKTEMAKWGGNPFTMVDSMNSSIETYQRNQEAHSEAARVMTQYDNDLYGAASKQPVFAEPPKFGVGSGEGTGLKPPGTGINMPGNGGTEASGFSGGSVPGGGTVPGAGGGGSYGSGGGSIGGGGSSVPTPLPAGNVTGSTPRGTNPSGYRPPTATPPRMPSRGGGNNGLNGMGAMPMGPMGGGGMGGAGGSDYSSKLGRGGAGGFGPGGSGSGAGAAPGASSGAAKTGMGPMGSGAAAPGAAAAAGGRGAGMAGGMGGAGRGGKGEDDAEHQRPTYLVEGDPDEVFGTDMRTAPPVIGE
ncbi:hypothetical protein JHE00_08465 [Prauserella sp. ASG 168]|uniref:PPE domain-containing protein n=2 Tax=Prauserella cavernicola TaxID=2800127 RepID=A0A934V4R0_9PSEU|nr:hypothetical protein [Prauserella cavernicola]